MQENIKIFIDLWQIFNILRGIKLQTPCILYTTNGKCNYIEIKTINTIESGIFKEILYLIES